MTKLDIATNNLIKLKHPLQSSLFVLRTNQQQISKMLTKQEKAKNQDQKLIIDALHVAQDNVSLALSCIQAQLKITSITTLIRREKK